MAATAKPDSHVYEYGPIDAMAAGSSGWCPAAQSIDYGSGPLDLGTQPMEPALRFLLVRHGDRVMAPGSYPRLGSYYELIGHPAISGSSTSVTVRGRLPHMTLAARVRFHDHWGPEVLSAWVRRAPRAGAAAAIR